MTEHNSPEVGRSSRSRENGIASPFRSTSSSGNQDRHARPVSAGSDSADEDPIARPLMRGTPGDGGLMAMVQRGPEENQQFRRKASFYGDVFAYRESITSTRDRVARESFVMAEVTTNVIVRPVRPSIDVC